MMAMEEAIFDVENTPAIVKTKDWLMLAQTDERADVASHDRAVEKSSERAEEASGERAEEADGERAERPSSERADGQEEGMARPVLRNVDSVGILHH